MPKGYGVCLVLLVVSGTATPDEEASDLPAYTIRQAAGPITVDGRMEEPSWPAAETVGKFVFPWWEQGEKEPTDGRMLWDENNLYVLLVAHDKHISANHGQRDDPVYEDDCVEVFVAPDRAKVKAYFNFEINAIGTLLDRSPHNNRSPDWNATGIKISIRRDGTLNDESDEDRSWTAEIAIPFGNFAGIARRLPPKGGDVWRLNLYRLGGKVNPQYSAWSDTRTPKPNYHVPERFGIVTFSAMRVAPPVVGRPDVQRTPTSGFDREAES